MNFCEDCPHDGRCLDACYRINRFNIEWIDGARDPRSMSNPQFPKGVDIDASRGAEKTCVANLPYPSKRIGAYVVTCNQCGFRAGATTAGRADDPRSIKIPCRNGASLINLDRVVVKPC